MRLKRIADLIVTTYQLHSIENEANQQFLVVIVDMVTLFHLVDGDSNLRATRKCADFLVEWRVHNDNGCARRIELCQRCC